MSLLDEIAQRAGVSRMTVSNVLNARTERRTSAALKRAEQIRRIAEELNYIPNAAAQALSNGRTNNIGLLFSHRVPEMRGIFHELLCSLTDTLEAGGYHLLFVPLHGQSARRLIQSQRFDGCVMLDPTQIEEISELLDELGIPPVLINMVSDAPVATVMPDDALGMRLAVDHLYALGHRRMAYYRAQRRNEDRHQSVAVRRLAFIERIQELGIGGQCAVGEEDADEFVARHSFGPGGITAVIGYTHDDTYLMLRHLARRGLQLPRDVSVMGFNNLPETDEMNPSLTMVDVRSGELGRLGGQILLEQILEGKPPRHVMVPETLVVRESTVPPPQNAV